MNTVNGKVVLRGTDVAIPRVLVSVYWSNLSSNSTSPNATFNLPHQNEGNWIKWGSVITDARGSFGFRYSENGKRTERNERPDIVVIVTTLDEGCFPENVAKSRLVTCIRRNAGEVEEFLIGVDRERLVESGVTVPEKPKVEEIIQQRRLANERRTLLDAESQRIFAEHVKNQREFERLAKPKVEKFMSSLSSVSREALNTIGQRYVADGSSVLKANKAAIRSSIEGRINHATVLGSVPLSDDEAAKFMDEAGNFTSEVPAEALNPVLKPQQPSISFGRRPIPSRLCRNTPIDPCEEILQGNGETTSGHNGQQKQWEIAHIPMSSVPIGQPVIISATISGNVSITSATLFFKGVGGTEFVAETMNESSPGKYVAQLPPQTAGTAYYYIQMEDGLNSVSVPSAGAANPYAVNIVTSDIPLLIENLMNNMTPPESATIFHGNRAGVEQVQQSVNGFTLHSGPADAPSIHDFFHLQIAFEHVWHELFDEGLESCAKDLYAQFVKLGIDSDEFIIKPSNIGLFKKIFQNAGLIAIEDPDPAVLRVWEITKEEWATLERLNKPYRTPPPPNAPVFSSLSLEGGVVDCFSTSWNYQEWLYRIATRVLGEWPFSKEELEDMYLVEPKAWEFFDRGEMYEALVQRAIRDHRRQGQKMIEYARSFQPENSFSQFHPLLEELEKALKEPYLFTVYAANRLERSVNFGVVTTYRQEWQPVNYQVGELLKTIPLAPKEVRRFTKKVSVRKSRAEKEVENNLHLRKEDITQTSRVETTIVQKSLKKTNFQMSAEGGVNIGIAEAKGSTAFSQSAETESQEVKKEFREAVFKAAEEYKSERTVEINVSTGEETTFEESGEINNPNDEIPVTYLFYQLQRRYRVNEKIHRVTPVVLVAQEFPKPNEIDEDWIIKHDWILRRVILDDSFIPAMNYLASKVVGDEFALKELYKNVEQQRSIVEELKEELIAIQAQVGRRYAALEASLKARADAIQAEEDSDGFVPVPTPLGVGLAPEGSDAPSPEAMQVREDAARDAYEREAKREKEIQGRLERETTALNDITETYTKNLSDHLNRKMQIDRLRIHLKSNIMYYMQAIWSHEPPDQRFFRLHEVQVPKLTGKTTYTFEPDPDGILMPPDWKKPYKLIVHCELDPNIEFQTLEEVADLDNLLGFKGNYMMFPLKKSNALTDFMMIPYLDAVIGIRDPDPLGNWTLHDFIEYVCCLRKKVSTEQFDKMLPGLQAAYQKLVNAPQVDDEIVIPTDSLFIEALPGVHPILEDFKLFHRVVDVKKVQAEVRGIELENVRMAARLIAGEREDPSIEKKVIIEGGDSVLVSPGDA